MKMDMFNMRKKENKWELIENHGFTFYWINPDVKNFDLNYKIGKIQTLVSLKIKRYEN